tara:strand:- start:4451 stop:4825 length:375 start_codon:yes stop_codon:yes gene_type:complete
LFNPHIGEEFIFFPNLELMRVEGRRVFIPDGVVNVCEETIMCKFVVNGLYQIRDMVPANLTINFGKGFDYFRERPEKYTQILVFAEAFSIEFFKTLTTKPEEVCFKIANRGIPICPNNLRFACP